MDIRIGEIIESNTASFTAEVCKGVEVPTLGAWVEIQTQRGYILYGVISLAEYGSVMPGRKATALGRSHEELQREMPQVMELLRTTFEGKLVGYAEPGGTLIQSLPPYPPGIHDFVTYCPPDVLEQLGPPFDFLRLLMDSSSQSVPGDELVIAAMRQLKAQYAGDQLHQYLTQMGRVLSRILHDDPERLRTLLRRIQ